MAPIGEDLAACVRRGAFTSTLAESPVPTQNMRVTAGPADDMDVAVVLGAITAWQRDREESGRSALAALDAKGSANLRLAETRGLLEMYTKNEDVAEPYLAKAVALGSTNASVLRSYAGLIALSEPERQDALLTKAAAISPDDIDVRIDLAHMLVARGRGAEALQAIGAITRIPRNRAFAFHEVLTLAAVSAGDADAAKAAAAKAVTTALTEPERTQAETLTREAATTRPHREITGRLTNVICGTGPTVIEVTTADGVRRLVIDDPRNIRTPASTNDSVTLECGAQSRSIRVGYVIVADADLHTVGAVRLIAFLK